MERNDGERLASIETELKAMRKDMDKLFQLVENKLDASSACRADLLERIEKIKSDIGKISTRLLVVIAFVAGAIGFSARSFIGSLL